jgi:ubiquinone/menaquinone biosynthesis C-methylase UbiE
VKLVNEILSQMKQRAQATWSSGDYSMIGVAFVLVSEQLCETIELHAGQKVLDVATGTGNTALAAARRYCDVTGIDFVTTWLDRAQERAAAEKLPVIFEEGDAEALNFANDTFDIVLSTFGCMFAPDQIKTAAELLRVCRPGGKIGLTSWTPQSYAGQLLKIFSKYAPPTPSGFASPILWGTEERIRELFMDTTTTIHITKRIFNFRFLSFAHADEINKKYLGPMVKLYPTLDENKKVQFDQDMKQLLSSLNRSGDDTLLLPSEYLEAVIIKQ